MEVEIYSLESLYDVLKNAKQAEDTAQRERIFIEEQIAALVHTKDVGQKTVTLSDGKKITVKRALNYRADCEAIQDSHCWVSLGTPAPIKTKTTKTLDEKGYEWYRSNLPEVFNKISKHVTVTPAKVSVTLKDK
jgi:hypothetical protein